MTEGLGHDLRIKYGLTSDPDDDGIAAWAARAHELEAGTDDPEEAGRRAALEVFGELDGIAYFSRADTIEALLARALATGGNDGMREIGVGLRIKYKLRQVPIEEEAHRWAALADRYAREGLEPEEAGRRAADELFEIVPNLVLKAEADTIEALLAQARKK